jgi:hypothetical protein
MSEDEVRRERYEHAALLVSRGQHSEAIEIYRALQADAPDDLKAFAALRDLYGVLGRTAELADQWWLLAELRTRAGRYLDAHFALERATSLDPDRGELHEFRAEFVVRHAGTGSRRALFRAAARAYIKAGNDEALWRVLRRVEEVCGEPFALIRTYVERLEQCPDDAAAAAGLDGLYRYLGWPTNAGDQLAAEVRVLLRTQGPLQAMQAQISLEKHGGFLDEAFYRELAERCEREAGSREAAEQMRRKADRVAGHKRWIH